MGYSSNNAKSADIVTGVNDGVTSALNLRLLFKPRTTA